MTSIQQQPFRLMDLPVELRLMVYERIPIRTRLREVYKDEATRETEKVTFVTSGLDVQFLATCKRIFAEAAPFLLPKVEIVRMAYPQINVDGTTLHLTDDVVTKIHFGFEFSGGKAAAPISTLGGGISRTQELLEQWASTCSLTISRGAISRASIASSRNLRCILIGKCNIGLELIRRKHQL
jgi:hypothetical protein